MKFEVDLSQIIDEDGKCLIPEFRNLIIDKVVLSINEMVEAEIFNAVKGQIGSTVERIFDAIIPEILDHEFQETGSYGYRKDSEPITVRNKILKDMEKAMVWKDGNFDSDKSPYTRVVKKAVEAKLNSFAQEFNKELNSKFIEEAMKYATEKFKKNIK
jgi:hypothetical protein